MKKAIIISIIFIIVGLILMSTGVSTIIKQGFNFGGINVVNKTIDIENDFTSIDVSDTSSNIEIKLSKTGKCYIECDEYEKAPHVAEVKNGKLKLYCLEEDMFDLSFSFKNRKNTIYLPKDSYEELSVVSTSGNVEIDEKISFNECSIITTSGNIKLSEVTIEDLDIAVNSGNIKLDEISCNKLSASTTSGNITIDDCRGNDIVLSVKSGNIKGHFLSDLTYEAKTSSGNVIVPTSKEGGTCKITTTSGNIDFD